MKKSELKKLIREEFNSPNEKWQIKFYGDDEEDVPYSEIFPTEESAVKFMRGQEWDEQVEFWGDNGPEYKTVSHYHNPEDGENYNDYEVEKIQENNLSEEDDLKNYTKGLHQAKVGDKVNIGREGGRGKWYDEISKVMDDGKVVTKGGDIFNKDGRLFRGKSMSFQKQHNPGKTVSAQIITQKTFDQDFKNIKISYLKNFDYSKLPIEDILKIIDSFPNHRQANTLNKSRFKQ